MTSITVTLERQTRYCLAIKDILAAFKHATNVQLLHEMRKRYPNASATTVHRATARLAERGAIGIAPSSQDGSMQYDANVTPHDHFQCTDCGLLRDTNIKDKVIPILESSIDGCSISGQITVSGTCKQCTQSSQAALKT